MAQAQPSQPRPWNPSFKHTDRERWICVYPAYINSRKSIKDGRRVQKNLCVDNPTAMEIRDVMAQSGLTIGVENKVYARELDHRDPKFRGRIRVQLRDEDGKPCCEKFPDRETVFKYICEMIPKLKTRQAGAQQSQQPAQAQKSVKNEKKKGRKGK